jgi:hypothetical protein
LKGDLNSHSLSPQNILEFEEFIKTHTAYKQAENEYHSMKKKRLTSLIRVWNKRLNFALGIKEDSPH